MVETQENDEEKKIRTFNALTGNDLVGKVFYASWGYDQTQNDFVKVIRVSPTGKTAYCKMVGNKRVGDSAVEPTETFGNEFALRIEEYNGRKLLRGSYPYCANATNPNDDSKRLDTFWEYKGEPVYETPEGFGH